jgi:hypothetical protein
MITIIGIGDSKEIYDNVHGHLGYTTIVDAEGGDVYYKTEGGVTGSMTMEQWRSAENNRGAEYEAKLNYDRGVRDANEWFASSIGEITRLARKRKNYDEIYSLIGLLTHIERVCEEHMKSHRRPGADADGF